MATIPLPALHVNPPEDPSVGLQRAIQLKSLLNQQALFPGQLQQQQQQLQATGLENQLRQQQVKDSQTLQTLAPNYLKKDSDGKPIGFDYEGFAADAQSKGVSPQTMAQLTTVRKNAADTVLANANAGKATLESQDKLNDLAYSHLEGIRGETDPVKRQTKWQAALQWASQSGVQGVEQLPPQAPDDKGLTGVEFSVGLHKQAIADAKEQATIFREQTETAKSRQGIIPPGGGLSPESQQQLQKDIAVATNPQVQRGKVQVAAAEGAARAATEIGTKRQEVSDQQYQTAIGADERLNRMEKSYTDAVANHNQQAMLALLTDHIGMTLGLQKGARITKDIINEAARSQPWLAGLAAKFDSNGYLSGVNLSPGQMKQMVDLGYSARENAWDAARSTSQLYGVKPPPNAQQVYSQRNPNTRVYNQGGMVTMRAPNGQTKQVRPEEVDHYKSLGASVVNQ